MKCREPAPSIAPEWPARTRIECPGASERAGEIEHAVVVDVDWRLDVVTASAHGARMNAPVAIVTLKHAEDENVGRTTYHVPISMVVELRAACDAILAKVERN